jgi:hypothetical protein
MSAVTLSAPPSPAKTPRHPEAERIISPRALSRSSSFNRGSFKEKFTMIQYIPFKPFLP